MKLKGRRNKVVLVFDEKDRRDFLTGFRKRKNVRRKKAQEDNRKKEEEKRKQLREEKREALRQHVEEYESRQANSTEADQDLVELQESITHDFGQHTVTVSSITDEDMGREFVACDLPSTTNRARKTDVESTAENHKQITKDKLHRKKQFRKKAQKRKIQAMGDKKSSKERPKQRGKRKNKQIG